MVHTEETLDRLAAIPELTVLTGAPLSRYTRFAIGGPADIYAETSNVDAFISALQVTRESGQNYVVIGGGTVLMFRFEHCLSKDIDFFMHNAQCCRS